MAIYQPLKSIYQAVVPTKLRDLARDQRYPFRIVFEPLKSALQRFAQHDEVYDESYYREDIEPTMRRSAEIMARSIVAEFHPRVVVDVGCGSGGLLEALKHLGIEGVGFENSAAAIAIARAKGIEIIQLDLEQPIDKMEIRRGDLAISTEVAEHIPERFADTFVDYLCLTADTVLLTAATPGQGGNDHVNEQPNEYWIEKFRARNRVYDFAATRRMRDEWKDTEVASFYHSNLMIFRAADAG